MRVLRRIAVVTVLLAAGVAMTGCDDFYLPFDGGYYRGGDRGGYEHDRGDRGRDHERGYERDRGDHHDRSGDRNREDDQQRYQDYHN